MTCVEWAVLIGSAVFYKQISGGARFQANKDLLWQLCYNSFVNYQRRNAFRQTNMAALPAVNCFAIAEVGTIQHSSEGLSRSVQFPLSLT